MNINRGSRTLVTCVAVICTLLIAACSGPKAESIATPTTPPTVQPTPSYDITRQTPAGYDEWAMSGTNETLPTMKQTAQVFGLQDMFVPKGPYDSNLFIGIAPLERYCLVVFGNPEQTPRPKTMSVTVISRYNPDLTITEYQVTVDKAKSRIDNYRAMCRGEAPVPAMTSDNNKV